MRFEELAWDETPIGTISLRRRHDPVLDAEVLEVKLDDEYLMSSLFTAAEIELARLGLAPFERDDLAVVVGGLGLGYTADAVLEDDRVGSLVVVEALEEVIDWHRRDLVPDVSGLAADPRTQLVHGDFFARAASDGGFDPDEPTRRFDAVLLDVDHSPRDVLDASHADLYTPDGLARLARYLTDDGVFALWSNDPPDAAFEDVLAEVFEEQIAHVVTFDNPYTGGESANTVYVATSRAVG